MAAIAFSIWNDSARCAFIPAVRHFFASSSYALAVMAMMGILLASARGIAPMALPFLHLNVYLIYITILTAGRQPYCSSIFSIKIPYPLVLSCTRTWVTAPTNLPFWMIGAPLIPWTIPPVRVIRSESVTFSSIPRFTLS